MDYSTWLHCLFTEVRRHIHKSIHLYMFVIENIKHDSEAHNNITSSSQINHSTEQDFNRARKSRRTLQNRVRIKVFPEQ